MFGNKVPPGTVSRRAGTETGRYCEFLFWESLCDSAVPSLLDFCNSCHVRLSVCPFPRAAVALTRVSKSASAPRPRRTPPPDSLPLFSSTSSPGSGSLALSLAGSLVPGHNRRSVLRRQLTVALQGSRSAFVYFLCTPPPFSAQVSSSPCRQM